MGADANIAMSLPFFIFYNDDISLYGYTIWQTATKFILLCVWTFLAFSLVMSDKNIPLL